jgi:hypothetical protein
MRRASIVWLLLSVIESLFLTNIARTQEPPLVAPPETAATLSIVSSGGQHGQERMWVDRDGVRWSRQEILLRGLVYDVEQAITVGSSGLPVALTIRGVTPSGDAAESFVADSGIAKWQTPADAGQAPWRDELLYVPFNETAGITATIINALVDDADGRIEALPSGQLTLTELTRLQVSANGRTESVRAVAIDGIGFAPRIVWLDENDELFASVGVLSWITKGWEGVRQALLDAQRQALAERHRGLVLELLKDPVAPVLFRDVTIYDGVSNAFVHNMSVLVDGAKITAVDNATAVHTPRRSLVINGAGMTLVPGLWDSHFHYAGEFAGALTLSQGITSVREVGNDRQTLLTIIQQIDRGELLGPNVYPILGIDGDGPLSAQSFVRIHSLDEGLAAVRRARDEGFLGIKLYGTIDPDWVAPMAAEAHRLGMSVQGHIPAGMRPSDAVAAGYDGINHINFIVMEAMPVDVIATSNGLNRFFGPGRYAKDLDLSKAPMAGFLQALAQRHVTIDPTLVVYEGLFVPAQGEITPSAEPFAGILPPRIEREAKSGGLTAPPEYAASRDDMRASFEALVATVAELHRRGVPIVAGTDGYPYDLVRELELYHRAGMTVEEALETATDGAARTVGADDEVGTIAVGQRADLLLVQGDVSRDIGALRQVDLVMRGGLLLDGAELRTAARLSGLPKR